MAGPLPFVLLLGSLVPGCGDRAPPAVWPRPEPPSLAQPLEPAPERRGSPASPSDAASVEAHATPDAEHDEPHADPESEAGPPSADAEADPARAGAATQSARIPRDDGVAARHAPFEPGSGTPALAR